MDYLNTIIFLLLSSLPAFLFLHLIDRNNLLGNLESIALSYGIGLGIVFFEMTLLSLFRLSFLNIVLPLAILSIILGILPKKKGCISSFNLSIKKFSKAEMFFICGITFEVLYAFFRALVKPMEAYDAVAVWALKSKAFFIHRDIPVELFRNPDYTFFNITNPFLLPFSESYIYLLLGSFNDFASKMLFPMFFLSCLILLYFALKRIGLVRKYALIFTFILASVPHFNSYATNGYADLIVGYYYSIGILFLYFWMEKRSLIFLIVSAIMSALTGCTKNEGILLALINIMIFLIFLIKQGSRRDLINKFFIYVAIIVFFILPSIALIHTVAPGASHHAFNIYTLKEFRFENLDKIVLVLNKYQKQFFGIKHWNLVWILFFVSLFAGFRKIFSGNIKFLSISVIFIFFAYTFIYLVSQHSEAWRSADRLFLDFLPVVVFLSAVGLGVRDA